MDDHAQREKVFHNRIYSERPRAPLEKYYSVAKSSAEAYEHTIQARCAGKRVLEIGSGTGARALALGQEGASVTAIDISEVAVGLAREKMPPSRADVTFRVMDAERLEFDDDIFDLICGRSVIHHLDIGRALREVGRTLRPDGTAVFLEPLGHNPVLNLYRRLTPALRSDDEHPLKTSDIDLAWDHFGSVQTSYFHLASLLAVPFRRTPGFGALLNALESVDRLLLATWLRRLAWIVVITLREPRKTVKT